MKLVVLLVVSGLIAGCGGLKATRFRPVVVPSCDTKALSNAIVERNVALGSLSDFSVVRAYFYGKKAQDDLKLFERSLGLSLGVSMDLWALPLSRDSKGRKFPEN